MTEQLDFTGYRAILYRINSKEVLAEAKVLRYERQSRLATIRLDGPVENLPEHVVVLLLGADVPVEYQGTLHRSGAGPNTMEVSLFRGKTKEERNSVRYPIDVDAVVDHFYISRKLFPTHRVMRVKLVNISAAGCLLRCQTPFFNVGTTFQMQTELFGKMARLNATVVRVKPVDECYGDYGCKFYFPTE